MVGDGFMIPFCGSWSWMVLDVLNGSMKRGGNAGIQAVRDTDAAADKRTVSAARMRQSPCYRHIDDGIRKTV